MLKARCPICWHGSLLGLQPCWARLLFPNATLSEPTFCNVTETELPMMVSDASGTGCLQELHNRIYEVTSKTPRIVSCRAMMIGGYFLRQMKWVIKDFIRNLACQTPDGMIMQPFLFAAMADFRSFRPYLV